MFIGVLSTNCERPFFPHLTIHSEVGDTIYFDYKTDTINIYVDCNALWYQNTFPEWIYMNPNTGHSSDTIMLVAWENEKPEPRDTILTIRTETIARNLILRQLCDSTIVEEEKPEEGEGEGEGENPEVE